MNAVPSQHRSKGLKAVGIFIKSLEKATEKCLRNIMVEKQLGL
jgi:hypothetical protein